MELWIPRPGSGLDKVELIIKVDIDVNALAVISDISMLVILVLMCWPTHISFHRCLPFKPGTRQNVNVNTSSWSSDVGNHSLLSFSIVISATVKCETVSVTMIPKMPPIKWIVTENEKVCKYQQQPSETVYSKKIFFYFCLIAVLSFCLALSLFI